MAIAAACVWEIRTAGDDANGGGFISGASGSDYSQTDTKRTGTGTDDSTTDAVANNTTLITSATANFGTSIVGNIICLSGGSGGIAKGWYQVVSRASTTNITVDRLVNTSSGMTMNIGGALASLGMLGGASPTTGNMVWIKSGTYTITSATNNISGGCASFATQALFIEGYGSSRGDGGTKPLLQADGVITTFVIIGESANGSQWIKNLKLDGNNRTSSRGITSRGHIYNCEFVNFTNSAATDSLGGSVCVNCSATGCSTAAPFLSISCIDCVAFDNTIGGFRDAGLNCLFIRCVSDSNSGATSDGFESAATTIKTVFLNCVSYNNGRDGFRMGGQRCVLAINCIAEANAGTGYLHVSNVQVGLFYCAAYNNTSANFTIGTSLGSFNTGSITGSGSFFTNAASQDFSLNDTANAGALVRATGLPGQITAYTSSTGYLDLGVYQHQDPAGGGGETSAVF